MTDQEKIEFAEELIESAEAEDFDGLVEKILGLVVRNNPKYAPFYPLACGLLRRVFRRISSKADGAGERRWFNPLRWLGL